MPEPLLRYRKRRSSSIHSCRLNNLTQACSIHRCVSLYACLHQVQATEICDQAKVRLTKDLCYRASCNISIELEQFTGLGLPYLNSRVLLRRNDDLSDDRRSRSLSLLIQCNRCNLDRFQIFQKSICLDISNIVVQQRFE